MEKEQIAFIRQHSPPAARITMDDDIWMDLHDAQPSYAFAHSRRKASSDPAGRDEVFHRDWQSMGDTVMPSQMPQAVQQDGPGEDYLREALSRATRVGSPTRGNVELSVYQVQQ